ncbi:MAG: DHH family phosphoesterase [Candidatus Nanoarchaeia archaeon]
MSEYEHSKNNLNIQKYGILDEFNTALNHVKCVLEDPQHSVFIFHDNDSDGLCSYLLLKNSYPTIKRGHFITKEIESQEIALQHIPEQTTHVICVDTPSIETSILTKLTSLYNVIILDHHVLDNNKKQFIDELISQNKLTYVNPLDYNSKDSRPVTYFCYLLSNKSEQDVQFALIGTIADFYITPLLIDIEQMLNNSKNENQSHSLSILFNHFNTFTTQTLHYITQTLRENTLYYLEENNKQENAKYVQMLTFSTQIGKLKFFFDFIFKNTTTAQTSIHLIEQFSLFELLGEINSGSQGVFFEFDKYYKKYQKIIQSAYSKFKVADKQQLYIIIEHKGKTSYNRQLSEQALYELDIDVAFSLHQRFRRGFISGSFRSKPHINLHTILNKVFEGIDNANWGGHNNACGCSFLSDDKELVISRFIELMNKK